MLEHAAFDVVILDADTWSGTATPVHRLLGQRPGTAVVAIGREHFHPGEHHDPRLAWLCGPVSDDELIRQMDEAISGAKDLRRRETMVRWLERETSTDPLTGLLNGRAFAETLRSACAREGATRVGLIVLNVVGTGMVNHNYGEETGDRMLRHCAQGVVRSIRASDVAARLEGDTFAVFVDGADLDLCRRIGRRIVQELCRANAEEWRSDIPVTVTIALVSGEGCDGDELLKSARTQLRGHRPFMPAPPTPDDLDDGPYVA